MKKTPTHPLSVRLSPALNQRFTAQSAKFGGRSVVVRELIQAFCDNRLTIQPPTIEGTIYESRK